MTFIFVCFATIFGTSLVLGSKTNPSTFPFWAQILTWVLFVCFTFGATIYQMKSQLAVAELKRTHNYKIIETDVDFTDGFEIFKISFVCGVAAVLCGMTGIAGGMVLGPLFLKYNMLPTIMSSTNQYITMIASISVVIQFVMQQQLDIAFASMFGLLSIVAAYVGLSKVNAYIKKTGKESLITILLTLVLVLALVMLPIDFIIKAQAADASDAVTAA